MHTIPPQNHSRSSPGAGALGMADPSHWALRDASHEDIEEFPTSRGYAAVLLAYRDSGGTVRSEQVARLLEDYGLSNFVGLPRLVASNEVFGFEWRGVSWVPMFQFNLRDLSVRPATERVLAELGARFDDWARAAWFARPNPVLQGRKPVDLMQSDLPGVINAARADRCTASA